MVIASHAYKGNHQKKQEKKHKIFHISLLVIISVVIGVGIYNINAKFLLHDPFPMMGGLGYSVVVSGSMEPELSIDDLLIVQQQDHYEPGDIIVYVDRSQGIVTHRLVYIDDDNKAVAKGDANNTADKGFGADNIKGKVILKIPKVGVLFNDYVKYTLIMLVLILLVLSFFSE